MCSVYTISPTPYNNQTTSTVASVPLSQSEEGTVPRAPSKAWCQGHRCRLFALGPTRPGSAKTQSLSLDFLGVGDNRTTASLCANHPFSFKEGGGHVERPRDSGAFPGEVPSRAQEGTRAAFLSGDPVDKCSATVSASLLPSTSRTGK